MVSVAVAIVLGLLASFVQSLGLTIQRRSHLVTARKPPESRPPEWRQPAWLAGFLIFIVANIGGTVFQIGALPIVMLAPLGAVSLLYNALLARFLLQDALGLAMILGTALILVGAVLIGYFGAIQEPPHSLDELLALFGRPAFIGLATVLGMSMACVLVLAHLADWQLTMQLQRGSDAGGNTRLPSLSPRRRKSASTTTSTPSLSSRTSRPLRPLSRRWSAPMLAPLDEVSETTSGVATPVLEGRDLEARGQGGGGGGGGGGGDRSRSHTLAPRDYGSIASTLERAGRQQQKKRLSKSAKYPEYPSRATSESIARTRLVLSVAFAAVSGTLSGLCLLLAKSGVELLVLTFALGRNQFNRLGSWFLVAVMLLAALAQLWYLNKSLKMADPTLVCPLAFCFYNTSSIALGLVYFDQLGDISPASLFAVVVGIIVLLAGVFIVSTKPGGREEGDYQVDIESQAVDDGGGGADVAVASPLLTSSPTETEALLAANIGGIGGPHLPPTTMTASTPPPPTLTASPTTSPPTSPRRRRRRTASTSSVESNSGERRTGMMAGLGLHLPSYPSGDMLPPPASPKRRSVSMSSSEGGGVAVATSPSASSPSPPPSSSSPHRRRASHSHIQSSSPSSSSSAPHSRSHSHSQTLYSTILNRGLSIGIGPSSPGFHIGPFSPSNDDDEEGEGGGREDTRRDEVARRDRTGVGKSRGGGGGGRNRRSFSEADVAGGNDDDADAVVDDGELGGSSRATQSCSTTQRGHPRQHRIATPRPRRRWFVPPLSRAREWWTANVTQSGEEQQEEQRREERRALLA